MAKGFRLSLTRVAAAPLFFVLVGAALIGSSTAASAQTVYASGERTAAALGHYARARSMLVEALAEFEQARKIARPDLLIDPEEWRLSVISRTEELNRVLDPQPRVTRSGVRFEANGVQIKHVRDQLPPVLDGAKESNTYGDEQREREREGAKRTRYSDTAARAARSRSLDDELNEFLQPETKKPSVSRAPLATIPPADTTENLSKPVEVAPTVEEPTAKKVAPSKPADTAAVKPSKSESAAVAGDSELDKVVEDAINDRLKKMDGEKQEAGGSSGE